MGGARAAFIFIGVAAVAALDLGLPACDAGSPAAPGVDAAVKLVEAAVPEAAPPSLSAGGFHTCWVRDGVAKCWGSNVFGELGTGTHFPSTLATPTAVLGGVSSHVVYGLWHACGLAGTTAMCWGANSNDELGHDQAVELDAGDTYDAGDARAGVWASRASTSVPSPVNGLSGVVALSLGSGYSCALLDGGTVSCWGSDLDGVLGAASDGGKTCAPPTGGPCSPTPHAITGLTGVAQISAAGQFAVCALKASDGTVWCWGDNADGMLGQTDGGGPTPVQVPGLQNAKQLAAGDRHMCALLSDGTVTCWGYGYLDQLGRDAGGCTPFACALPPAVVSGLTGVIQVGCGEGLSCALRGDGTVACWGQNRYGQLGGATDAGQSFAPQTIASLSGVMQIAVGASHVCALGADASVACWGSNGSSELGPGSDAGFAKVPVAVEGL